MRTVRRLDGWPLRGGAAGAPPHRRPDGLTRRRLLALGLGLALAPLARPAEAQDPFEALLVRRLAPPVESPDFAAATPAGDRVRLADFRGKAILLNFWATWCPPCVTELPALERLHRRHAARDFVVLALSMDAGSASTVGSFVRRRDLTFPVGLDPAGQIARRFGVRALPTTLVLDRQGRIVGSAIGPRAWDGPDAEALVQAVLHPR